MKEKKVLYTNIICIILVLTTGIIRIVSKNISIEYNLLIFILPMLALLLWLEMLKAREVTYYHQAYQYFYYIVYLSIFWTIIKTIKYEIVPDYLITSHYLWYLYYIPTIYIPVLMYLAVNDITNNKTLSKVNIILHSLANIFILCVLTNDYHQLVFKFNNGLADHYQHQIMYFIIVIFISVLFLLMLIKIFKACLISKYRNEIYIPVLIIMILLVDVISQVINFKPIKEFLTFPELFCFIYIAFIESLLSLHLLPTNTNYMDFLENSTLGVGIYDTNGKIFAKSKIAKDVSFDIVESNKRIKIGDYEIISNKINNAYSYYQKDIKEINKLNEQLKENNLLLQEENSILQAQKEADEKQYTINKQNELYDKVSSDLSSYIIKIEDILKHPSDDEEIFIRQMKKASIYNVYIKRRSNLLLLSYDNEDIDINELGLCLKESMEYLNLYGTKASCFNNVNGVIKSKDALDAYETFQNLINDHLEDMLSMMVNINDHYLLVSIDTNNEAYTIEVGDYDVR